MSRSGSLPEPTEWATGNSPGLSGPAPGSARYVGSYWENAKVNGNYYYSILGYSGIYKHGALQC